MADRGTDKIEREIQRSYIRVSDFLFPRSAPKLIYLRYLVSSETPMSAVLISSYPVGSLKSQLCVRSRQMLYDRCEALDLPFRKTQKVHL